MRYSVTGQDPTGFIGHPFSEPDVALRHIAELRGLGIDHIVITDETGRDVTEAELQRAASWFVCHLDADGEGWTVWDRVANAPASLGGRELVGCTRERAEAARDILKRIYANGMNAYALNRR